jgi:hypothetical protein
MIIQPFSSTDISRTENNCQRNVRVAKLRLINLVQCDKNIRLSACHVRRITLSRTHKTLNTLTTEDASHQPIECCTSLMKCRLEMNCQHIYSIMHTDSSSNYYAKLCFEILMCLRLVQQLLECGTTAGNSGGKFNIRNFSG